MNNELDRELAGGLLHVPPDFEQGVMARVDAEATRGKPAVYRRIFPHQWLEWLVLASATIIGLVQLTSFMFGVWSVSSLP